jgi:hypothetical protein
VVDVKRCFKCEQLKFLSDFYSHPQMTDGRLGKCKDCTKEDVRINRGARREQYAKYEQARFGTPERKAQRLQSQKRHRARYPEKDSARQKVSRAVRSGRLIRPDYCTSCGRQGDVQAHHRDYSRPLDVDWLCFACHREHGHGQVVIARDRGIDISGEAHT